MKTTDKKKQGQKGEIGFKQQGKKKPTTKREREPDIEAENEVVNRRNKIQEPEDAEEETEDKPKRRERFPDIEAENENDAVKNDKKEKTGNKQRGENPDATDNRSDSPH